MLSARALALPTMGRSRLAFASSLASTRLFADVHHARGSCATRPVLPVVRRQPHTMSAGNVRNTSEAFAPLAPVVSEAWELDFYSRPVVGLDGKKLWELIITDSTGCFEHIEAIPNSMVNSRELRKRVQAVIDDASRKPVIIRFFRSQMFNMIQIALSEIDVQVFPSRRTYALFQLIKDREENVYRNMPGFKEDLSRQALSFSGIDLALTQRLPDALRCESFAFGELSLGQLEEFFDGADTNDYFGDRCIVDPLLPKDTMVPGMIVISKRAKPLSAWASGIELAYIKATLERQEVVLECGLNTVYRFAQITEDLKDDARKFGKGKAAAAGLHFLAVQQTPTTDEIDGMWLLCES